MKWTDTIIALSTVVMTLATIAIGYLAYQTGGQTDQLIDAAQRQAGAATTFSESADRIDTKIGQAEKDFQAMADSSKQSIEAAQTSFRDDQRAWITVSQINLYFDPHLPQAPLGAQLEVVNVGKTPALHVTQAFSRFIWPPPRLSQPTPQLIKGLVFSDAAPIAPGPLGKMSVSLGNSPQQRPLFADWPSIKNGSQILYIFGEIRYGDTSRRQHSTKFCFYLANLENNVLASCGEYSDMN